MYLRVVSDTVEDADGVLRPQANIQVINRNNGDLLADVYVEIYDGKARLVITPAIVPRESDESTHIMDLLTGELTSSTA